MTPWLEKRLTWDKKMVQELLDEMFEHSRSWQEIFLDAHLQCFNPRSSIRIIGLEAPK